MGIEIKPMSSDDAADTPVGRALKRRKELEGVIKASMKELEKIDDFLKLYRHWSAPPEENSKGGSDEPEQVSLTRKGFGLSQSLFEHSAREILREVGHPLSSPDFVEEFRKRGQPLGGNEIRAAWNKLWLAKDRGVLVHIPKFGYWLADEPLPEGALTVPRTKRAYRPKGQSQRSQWTGRRIGRKPILTESQVKAGKEWILAGKSRDEVCTHLGGISVTTFQNYFGETFKEYRANMVAEAMKAAYLGKKDKTDE
jgi:hypothetical protein